MKQGKAIRRLLAYTPNEDMMVYGQWAEGFRPGKGLPPNLYLCCSNIDHPLNWILIPQKTLN